MFENYQRALEDKKKIDEIIQRVEKDIKFWFENDKKDFEDDRVAIIYNKNTYNNAKKHRLRFIYDDITIALTDDIRSLDGYYVDDNEMPLVVLKTVFKEKELKYDKIVFAHELQHYVDYQTKYKYKKDAIEKSYSSFSDDYSSYISQPVEFNAFFTSMFFEMMRKHKDMEFSDIIKKIYTDEKYVRDFLMDLTRPYRKKFLKRFYNYYQEEKKNS